MVATIPEARTDSKIGWEEYKVVDEAARKDCKVRCYKTGVDPFTLYKFKVLIDFKLFHTLNNIKFRIRVFVLVINLF